MLNQAKQIAATLQSKGFHLYNKGYKSWSFRQDNINIEVHYNAWQYAEPFSVTITGMMSLINPSPEEVIKAYFN